MIIMIMVIMIIIMIIMIIMIIISFLSSHCHENYKFQYTQILFGIFVILRYEIWKQILSCYSPWGSVSLFIQHNSPLH